VVEHLPEPVELVRHAAEALEPSRGVLDIELPDKRTVFERPRHRIIFSVPCTATFNDVSSIATLLGRAGLTALRIDSFNEPSGKITAAAFASQRAS
jgi:hypothetical protein